jgi:hypothetical protein
MMEVATNVISLDGGITENTYSLHKALVCQARHCSSSNPTNGAYDPQPCYVALTFT